MKKSLLVTALGFSLLGTGFSYSSAPVSATELIKINTIQIDPLVNQDFLLATTIRQEKGPNGVPTLVSQAPNYFKVLSKERSGGTGWTDYQLISSFTAKANTFLGWHPAFGGYSLNVSAYNFTHGSASVSFSLGGAFGSVSVSYNPEGAAGYSITSNPALWSRPGIFGDIIGYNYKANQYNGTGTLIGSSNVTFYGTTNTYIKTLYK